MGLPVGPVVKAWRFQCRGPGFDSWLGTKILQATWYSSKKKKKAKLLVQGHTVGSMSWGSIPKLCDITGLEDRH